ncbi:hypothetical protein FF38_10541 [Lucilia cuprina]|uniref:Uncharacterized protein n=1 Tax=Lucilia cuprina TaxID=7375 RepID=A0A0L0BWR0_LUCCU|nr:hypothetical protein FF38_10541 [Lucilia cuprina]
MTKTLKEKCKDQTASQPSKNERINTLKITHMVVVYYILSAIVVLIHISINSFKSLHEERKTASYIVHNGKVFIRGIDIIIPTIKNEENIVHRPTIRSSHFCSPVCRFHIAPIQEAPKKTTVYKTFNSPLLYRAFIDRPMIMITTTIFFLCVYSTYSQQKLTSKEEKKK